MREADLVTSEFYQAGFRAKMITSNSVKVSLSSRKVSTMEVSLVLDQEFDGIEFDVKSVIGGVLVSW